jgi:hypothetical protein
MNYIQVYRIALAGKCEHSILSVKGRTRWATKANAVKHSIQFNERHKELVSEVVRE